MELLDGVDESDEDEVVYYRQSSVAEAVEEMDVRERNAERGVEKGSDGPMEERLERGTGHGNGLGSTSAEKQPTGKKRKRDVGQEEEKNVLPYRTRSKRRASIEAKKRVFRPRHKRQ